ncbi:MAG: ATP-grasp domain-containing protein [Archaeoglobaceae archaeon]|nr:ATP-grasp domain-containing protein [Archaeoglobaceae archaeon]MDW7989101.1 ATP-grasp domain-containing protein [Archaeoglobaceae archaeon]
MKLFLFEFATCGDEIPEHIAVEGLAMFKTLFKGFLRYYNVLSFVRRQFSDELKLPPGKIDEIENWLEKSDAFLIVAPEDDYKLLKLTEIGEKYCENLGSSSRAIAITSDKWKLYKRLRRKVLMPKTSKKELEGDFIVKPRVSCGGEGIKFSRSIPENYIAQEYIKGENLSASLILRDDIRVVSINEQIIEDFKYKGAIVPARIEEEKALEVCKIAIEAVESIKGLKGYVGVDIVYAEQPYVIELNARITTPIIAFERAYGINVVDMLKGYQIGSSFKRQKLEKGQFNDFFAKVGNYTLRISDF